MSISPRPKVLILLSARRVSQSVLKPPSHPSGGNTKLFYEFSQTFSKDPESVSFWEDPDIKNKLSNCKKLSTVKERDYAAIFYIGGRD